MKKEIDYILEEYYQKRIDLLEARKQLLLLFSVIASASFDSGFNISNERFNAEFRDDYLLFDEDDIKKYEQLKNDAIFKIFL
jgi:hypothetical protein